MNLTLLLAAAAAATTAVHPSSAAVALRAEAPATEVKMPHITVQSIGTGEPVVLIPGLATPRDVWKGVSLKLASNRRLILVQIHGFGSGAHGANTKPGIIEGAVADVARYLAAEKIERVAVIGHSMGGLMAMMLASDHPSKVGRLMIVDALPFYGMLMGPGATPDSVRPVAERMRSGLLNGPTPSQAPPHMSNSEAGRAKVLEWLRASDPRVVGQAMLESATTDFRPKLPTLSGQSVTVVYAVPSPERAELTRALYAQAYADLPEARMVAVRNSGHFIMLDQPEHFAEEVRRFLN